MIKIITITLTFLLCIFSTSAFSKYYVEELKHYLKITDRNEFLKDIRDQTIGLYGASEKLNCDIDTKKIAFYQKRFFISQGFTVREAEISNYVMYASYYHLKKNEKLWKRFSKLTTSGYYNCDNILKTENKIYRIFANHMREHFLLKENVRYKDTERYLEYLYLKSTKI